jgi:hypothetical protein
MTITTANTPKPKRRKAGLPPPPLRKPEPFETSLSPAEIERGVRDGTLSVPGSARRPRQRDLRAGPSGGYVTKGPRDQGDKNEGPT